MIDLNEDIVVLLHKHAKPNSDLKLCALQLTQVARRIADAVSAPYQPSWADPATLAKGIFEDQYALMIAAADEIERLRAQNKKLRAQLDALVPA